MAPRSEESVRRRRATDRTGRRRHGWTRALTPADGPWRVAPATGECGSRPRPPTRWHRRAPVPPPVPYREVDAGTVRTAVPEGPWWKAAPRSPCPDSVRWMRNAPTAVAATSAITGTRTSRVLTPPSTGPSAQRQPFCPVREQPEPRVRGRLRTPRPPVRSGRPRSPAAGRPPSAGSRNRCAGGRSRRPSATRPEPDPSPGGRPEGSSGPRGTRAAAALADPARPGTSPPSPRARRR
jgi:hypothetical protein